jgi:hypothetical protein
MVETPFATAPLSGSRDVDAACQAAAAAMRSNASSGASRPSVVSPRATASSTSCTPPARFGERFRGHARIWPWVCHGRPPSGILTQRGAVASARLKSLYRSFKGAAERTGLRVDLSQHELRHRGVTTWLAQGKSPVLVQKAMGHADIAATMGYRHLVDEHLLPRRVVAGHRSLDEGWAFRNRLEGPVSPWGTGPSGVQGFGRAGGFSVRWGPVVSGMCPVERGPNPGVLEPTRRGGKGARSQERAPLAWRP